MNETKILNLKDSLEVAKLAIAELSNCIKRGDLDLGQIQVDETINGHTTIEFMEGEVELKPIISGQMNNPNQSELIALGLGSAISVNGKETPVYPNPDKTQDEVVELIKTELSRLRN